jgi:SpoVK/Ycf46/Vps4 family AAA+-type ATPase
MIQYLQVKAHHASKNKFIVFRERNKKFDKKVKETYIPKKDSLILYGMNASGKTKEIKKIWNAKKDIWSKDTFIWLSAGDSLSEWLHVNLRDKDTINYAENNHEEFREHGLSIDREINKQYVKLQILANKAKGAIIFIDDIDHLSGKKLEIAKDILRECKQYMITADNEHGIDKTLLNILKKKKAKEIDLTTEASYDATNVLVVMFIMTMFVTGQYELGALVMVARYMMKGKGK